MTKRELRDFIRSQKKAFTKEQLAAMSEEISCVLLQEPALCKANVILAYFPLPDEVSIRTVIDNLVSQGKIVLLPQVVSDTTMILREYHSEKDLRVGCFGISEPTGTEFTAYEKIEVALVPGMAFDSVGNRLGRGKGYYDRFLHAIHNKYGKQPHLIGVAFPFQIVAEVPSDEHDIRMDKVVYK